MKILKNKKTKKVSNVNTIKRPFLNRIGRNVHTDWSLIVGFSFVLALVVVSLGIVKYVSFDENLEKQISATNKPDNNGIDTKSLDRVLLKYEQKAMHRSELIKNYVGPRDPSI